MINMASFSVDIDGYSLDFVRQGAGQPLILVHGTVSDARTWQKHVEILSASFDVIAPSLRYFGSQPWPDDGKEFGTARHATDLLKLVEACDLEDVICVGWSYGGNVALHAGLLDPRPFKKLFLYEPAAASLLNDKTKLQLATADRIEMFSRTAKLLETDNPKAVVETFLDDAAGMKGSYKSMPDYARRTSRDNAQMLNLLLTMVPADLSTDSFLIPTLVACGEDTREFYRITAEGLQQQCSSINVKWIPSANHLWPITSLELFCDELLELA